MPKRKSQRKEDRGRLRIGDAWNAITIIALSQENPLKAIAEFVENSIKDMLPFLITQVIENDKSSG